MVGVEIHYFFTTTRNNDACLYCNLVPVSFMDNSAHTYVIVAKTNTRPCMVTIYKFHPCLYAVTPLKSFFKQFYINFKFTSPTHIKMLSMSSSKSRKIGTFYCPNPNCSKPSLTGYRGYGRFENHLNVYDNCNQFWLDSQEEKMPANASSTLGCPDDTMFQDDNVEFPFANDIENNSARDSCCNSQPTPSDPNESSDFCSYTKDHKSNLELIQLLD